MSWWMKLLFLRDAIIGGACLVVGRLLPTLRPADTDLRRTTAIVTGANSGIGLATVREIAKRGATVYLACRSKAKAEAAIQAIIAGDPDLKGRLLFAELDVSSVASIRRFVDNWSGKTNARIDLLFHNAGMAKYDEANEFSGDGFEMTYATNFLGSFLLTHLLEQHLSSTARVIFTASFGNYGGSFTNNFRLESVKQQTEGGFHHPDQALPGKFIQTSGSAGRYGNTKAMQTIFARLLQRHFDHEANVGGDGSRRLAYSYSPGYTKSELLGKMDNVSFAKEGPLMALQIFAALATESEQGSATAIWLATTDDKEVTGTKGAGCYYDRMVRRVATGDIVDDRLMERMWARWEKDAGIEWR